MKDGMFLSHFIGVLSARTDFPTSLDDSQIDELAAGFKLAEVEGARRVLGASKDGGLFRSGAARRFGLSAGFFEIGEEFRHEGLLLCEFLKGCPLFPLKLGF